MAFLKNYITYWSPSIEAPRLLFSTFLHLLEGLISPVRIFFILFFWTLIFFCLISLERSLYGWIGNINFVEIFLCLKNLYLKWYLCLTNTMHMDLKKGYFFYLWSEMFLIKVIIFFVYPLVCVTFKWKNFPKLFSLKLQKQSPI